MATAQHRASCLQARPEVAALADRIEAALRSRRAHKDGSGAPRGKTKGSALGREGALRHEMARNLAAKYIRREARSLALLADDDDGIGGKCLRHVTECEDAVAKVCGAGGGCGAEGLQQALASAARQAVAKACGHDYAACCELAGDYVRPRLAQRSEAVAEACAAMLPPREDGLPANLAATALALTERQRALTAAVRKEKEKARDAQRELNETLRSIVLLTKHLLTTYRIPAEEHDAVYSGHLLTMASALNGKLDVLQAEVAVETYTPDTVPALRSVQQQLQMRARDAAAELREVRAQCAQYDEAEASPDFAALNAQVAELEKERAVLEKEVVMTRRT